MLLNDLLSITSFEKLALTKAKKYGFGLEVEEYVWAFTEEEILERNDYVPKLTDGFSKISFHGTAISRDIGLINKLSNEKLLDLYNESYNQAYFHKISKIVYHSNYLTDYETKSSWINNKTVLWKQFLQNKPMSTKIYIENFIYDTPDLLAELCDSVDDTRFKICFDIGHACCNSQISIIEWIKKLGKRIEHIHLHNNDGISDKHWSLGKGVLNIKEIITNLLEYANSDTFVLECNFDESLLWLSQNDFLIKEL